MTFNLGTIWKFIKIPLLIAAIVLLTIQSWGEITNWWIVIGFLVIGYVFGLITCSPHVRKYGLVMTLGLFALLNLTHSLIDGVTLVSKTKDLWLAILAHELVRQTSLYAIISEALSPFIKKTWILIITAIISVTGIWLLGIFIGSMTSQAIVHIGWLDPYLPMMMFILVGDMIHHVVDELGNHQGHTHA